MAGLSVFILRLAISFRYIKSKKYCVVEIMVERIRLVIYDKDQLRKNWYLISLKHIFVMGRCYFFTFE